MEIPFVKYSAAGNCFLAFDGRVAKPSSISVESYVNLANEYEVDGFLFVEDSKEATFKMTYLNADGGEVAMCGNGARAITHFAHSELGLRSDENEIFTIQTSNSFYESVWGENIRVKMTEIGKFNEIDVSDLFSSIHSTYMTVGVPHAIFQVDDVDRDNVLRVASKISKDKRFENGTNVNFFQIIDEGIIKLRTYERGVERETGSCGTGATATSLFCAKLFSWKDRVRVQTLGGDLLVSFDEDFKNVFLSGPVIVVKKGTLAI